MPGPGCFCLYREDFPDCLPVPDKQGSLRLRSVYDDMYRVFLIFAAKCRVGESFQFLRENIIHVVGIRIRDKRMTLFQDTVQSCVAHEKPWLGFLLFQFYNTLKIWPDGTQKFQIIRDIFFCPESIFRQKNGKLCLHTQAWSQRLIQGAVFPREALVWK